MATEITMPKLSDTMEEGTVLKWRVKEGDRVAKGDILAEVETDKAAMEMEAFEDGVIGSLKVPEGETVAVGTVIAVLEGEGGGEEESAAAPQPQEPAPPAQEPVAPEEEKKKKEERAEEREWPQAEGGAEGAPVEEDVGQKEVPAAAEKASASNESTSPPLEEPSSREMAAASPAARKLAREKGLVLARVRGTGPGGRIVLADVERVLAGGMPARGQVKGRPVESEQAPAEGRTSQKSLKVRRIVARKMVESWQSIPHFFVTVAVDMTDVIRIRKDLDASINDFILAAVSHSLQEHPWVNSHWVDGEGVEQPGINIAMAVATDRGLYNPVLRDCSSLSLRQISRRSAELTEKAHRGSLSQEDLEGGSFTISNMGMLGVESFSAIITPPQAAVLAVGTVKGEVVVDEHGEPAIAPMLRLTLSADHRILDGADAAEFLTTVKSYLEAPVTLVTCNYGKEE